MKRWRAMSDALELRPDHADAQNSLANALSMLGRLDEAVAFYRKSIESKPGIATYHVNLGNCAARSGEVRRVPGELRTGAANGA